MAIYHCSISNVSRAKGAASTATLSYITGEKVKDDRIGKTFNGFGRTERIEATGVMLPKGASDEFRDAANMFNSIEQHEKADNARTAKKIEIALPRECDKGQHIEMVEAYIRDNINANAYAAAYAIHYDKEINNPHAHILVPNRQINQDTGVWEKTKTRKEYARDKKGERIPIIDPETGAQKVDSRNRKQWRRVTVEQNLLDKREFLEGLREAWARECNRHLTLEQKIDHRSLKEQCIEREPTIHEGYAARQIEERGGTSERMEENRKIRESNGILEQIRETLREILAELSRLFHLKVRQEEQNREKYERLVKELQSWIEKTPFSDRFFKHRLPDYPGKFELSEMRAKLTDLEINGRVSEFRKVSRDPHFLELKEREQQVETMIAVVEKGMDKGESFKSIVERVKTVLEGHEDERWENIPPMRKRGLKDVSDDLEERW